MAETGTFDEELVKKIYAKAGKSEPPAGHLFVRQAFTRVFDTPVEFRDPDQPFGTHVYTAMKFGPKDTTATWVTVNVQDEEGARHVFTIVGEDEADPERGLISWVSPLGRALLNRRVGDAVRWQRPVGDLELEILSFGYSERD